MAPIAQRAPGQSTCREARTGRGHASERGGLHGVAVLQREPDRGDAVGVHVHGLLDPRAVAAALHLHAGEVTTVPQRRVERHDDLRECGQVTGGLQPVGRGELDVAEPADIVGGPVVAGDGQRAVGPWRRAGRHQRIEGDLAAVLRLAEDADAA